MLGVVAGVVALGVFGMPAAVACSDRRRFLHFFGLEHNDQTDLGLLATDGIHGIQMLYESPMRHLLYFFSKSLAKKT